MAANYNQFKQAWDMMDENQRKQQTELYKDNSQFQQFAQQYANEKNGGTNAGGVNNTTQNNNSSNSNNQNGSNGSYDPIYYRENNSNQNQGGSTLSDGRNGDGNFYGKTSFDKEETFDKSMIGEANGIKIQEGTGKETGRPDYKEDSEARLNEMRNNLNQYYQTNPEWFQDREVFNRQFEYNERESDAQRAVLDSYWKKAQDSRTASSYTNPNMVTNAFNSGDLTPGVLDAIKYNNPDLYAQWQKEMQDDLNARIANYAVPRTATETADIWMELVKKLGLEQGDPYQIYDNWVSRCEELGVFNMNNQLSSYISEMEQVKGERTAAMQRVMTQGAGRKSQALINAEVSKTSALYDARFADLQNMYQATYNQRQQNLAIANASAQALQMQAQEDQRIFNNKITGLGFAMKVDDYRTPEQQLQNQLRFNAISNDLQLLNKAKSNDLELYNKYATAKLNNQLAYELTDLTTTDPTQLRANLKNVLDPYYEKFGDIIERSESQVIEDVIAYAKEKGISVAEALRENFTKQLMAKDEYANYLKNNYAKPESKYQTTWDWIDNGDGTTTLKVSGYGEPPADLKTRADATNYNTSVFDSVGTVTNYAAALPGMYPDGTTYASTVASHLQCGEFVNDYLQGMGLGKKIGSYLDEKEKLIDPDAKATLGAVAVFDYGSGFADSNGRKYGHVAVVTGIDSEGNIYVTDANYSGNGDILTHKLSANDLRCLKGFYNPSKDLKQGDDDITVLAKDLINGERSYSEIKASYNSNILKQVENRATQLKQQGYEKSTIITDPNKQASIEDKLRKQYDSSVDGYKEILNWYNNAEKAYKLYSTDKSAATQAIIMGFNKIMDPDSVVREGEYDRTAQAQSLERRIQGKIENWTEGGAGVTKEMIDEVMDLIREFKVGAEENMNAKAQQIKVSIDKYGLTPEAVLPIDVLNSIGYSSSISSQGIKGVSVDSVVARIKNAG